MATWEEELKRFEPIIKRLSYLALLGKKIEVWGKENFIRTGPNLIVGNHIGTYKDIAVLFKIIPRPIFFTANRQIFSREEFDELIGRHLERHLKKVGLFINLLLGPLKSLFVQYVSTNIARIGTIPVDLVNKKKDARHLIENYLRQGRAVIALQGRGRVKPNDPNPYVDSFKPGASAIIYNLFFKNGLVVPVTPLAIYGTQRPFLIPATIRVKVGEAMFITDYLKESASATIEYFRQALENRVKRLFLSLI
ncbi:MAG: 1-acyl-sn-glycerol-3-phosphate acyltransferase [Candidatus Aminicenantes bacterium]|nr:1-acyl-sn-glycerol-3-phosphate acyltransferase [Candidatus Aminicenantes bacterium]